MKTREFILEKTFGLLLQKGYDGVSVSDIQQLIGMARGLLYHYFGSLEQLFEAALESGMGKWLTHDKAMTARQTVPEGIAWVAEKCRQSEEDLRGSYGPAVSLADVDLLFREAARHHKSLATRYFLLRNEFFIMWKNILLNSFSLGQLRSGLNLESVARQFCYIQYACMTDFVRGEEETDWVYVLEKSLREFWEIVQR